MTGNRRKKGARPKFFEEYGVVSSICDGRAKVRFQACDRCEKCRKCRVLPDGVTMELEVADAMGSAVGDKVKVRTDGREYPLFAALVYAIPVVLAAICLGVGCIFGVKIALCMCAAGIAAGFIVAVPIDLCVLKRRYNALPKLTSESFEESDSPSK